VLTADRPPELRDWGAGQTIDQVRLFGSHVRWFAEAPPPERTDALLRYARSLACRAVAEAQGPPAGPVHLNLPFREPLHPAPDGSGPPDPSVLAAGGRGARPHTFVSRSAPRPHPREIAELVERARAGMRGIVACGPSDADADLPEAVTRLARAAGWPVFAEPTSQLRCGPHTKDGPILATGDLLLRDASFAGRHAPDLVLRFGAPPTSRALRLWLERHAGAETVVVDADGGWGDPSHVASQILRADPVALCDAVARRLVAPSPATQAWLDTFVDADRRASAALEALVDCDETLLSPRAVRELAAAVPEGALVYASNSMPVRDLDAYLPVSRRRLRVLCNRGANGIDGMVSSAVGAAAACGAPVVLFTGDLAFVHDAGGLLAALRHGIALVVVVLNDEGGGIFSYLPIAAHGEAVGFEELFRVPHGLELGALARGYGAGFARITSWSHFRAALKDGLASPGATVIEIPVDRDRNVEHHHDLERAVVAAVRRGAGP
jgi:2-succinyl-5-enolpyruvyl-6-hydroxy-3-cyclohexene-1-carboxylate synthase